MKKFMFIICSVMLAAGLFAFTVTGSKNTNPDPELYWYFVTYDGDTPMIEYQEPTLLTKEDADGLGYDCEGDGRICRAGFLTMKTFNGENPILVGTTGIENYEETDPNQ